MDACIGVQQLLIFGGLCWSAFAFIVWRMIHNATGQGKDDHGEG